MRLESSGPDLRGAGAPSGLTRPPIADELVSPLRVGAALGAAAVTISSTGSPVVAAVLLGVAVWSRVATVAVVVAVAAAMHRFGVSSFDQLAGAQSVLGPAGIVGPESAAAASWLAALAVALAAVPAGDDRFESWAVAAAGGPLAAAVVVGAGPGGALGLRAGVSVGVALLLVVGARFGGRVRTTRLVASVVVAAAALAAAGWPA